MSALPLLNNISSNLKGILWIHTLQTTENLYNGLIGEECTQVKIRIGYFTNSEILISVWRRGPNLYYINVFPYNDTHTDHA